MTPNGRTRTRPICLVDSWSLALLCRPARRACPDVRAGRPTAPKTRRRPMSALYEDWRTVPAGRPPRVQPAGQPDPPRSSEVYDKYCVGCHGEAGDGKGPGGRTADHPATGLHQRRVQVPLDRLGQPAHGIRSVPHDQPRAVPREHARFPA